VSKSVFPLPSHLHSSSDFWRHFGLCRAAAHSDCCFCCAVYKYSYLLTRCSSQWNVCQLRRVLSL